MSEQSQQKAQRPHKVKKSRRKNPEGAMPLKAHLKELRNRVIKSGLAIIAGTIVGFIFYKPVFAALVHPLTRLSTEDTPTEVVFSSVAQPFDIMFQVAIFVGLIISSPIWLYQIWAFIVPGLKKKERRYAMGFIGAAVPLFLAGVVLGWYVLPKAMQFFTGLTPEGTAHRVMADVYIPFVTRVLLAFGIALVLPVILVGLNLAGVIRGKTMLKHWRISIFLIAVLAAMTAPGSDVVSMFYLGGPLMLLFGLAIAIAMLNDRRRDKKRLKAEEFSPEATPLSEL